jgi:two-component system sensor histidine kinase SenX3
MGNASHGDDSATPGPFARELRRHAGDLVQRWYEAWRQSSHPRCDVSEAALKDMLGQQLEVIGEQLENLQQAESTERMWKVEERLDPEERLAQDIPVEEVVQEYRLVVTVARAWIRERKLPVSFDEYSYFFDAIFQLAAESVKRYVQYQAESVSVGRAEYLAGIMHQMRGPLSALGLQIEALGRKSRPVSEPALARIGRTLDRLMFLVNGVLRVERYRPEEMPVAPRPVCPARLVEEILADHEHVAVVKDLRVEVHIDPSLQMVLDPDLFTDCIGNFVQNAFKFTDTGYICIDAEEHRDHVLFRVKDSGCGVPPERLASLFKAIQPGSGGGAGIGLQIAKHAAEAQGGTVGVESTPGGGSTFWLRLPHTVPARST